MLTKEDIQIIFSNGYAKAALHSNIDMRNIAELFENTREQIDLSDPFDTWDFMIFNPIFNNDASLELILFLKDIYFETLYEKFIKEIHTTFAKNEANGIRLWNDIFAMAAVHLKDDLMCNLFVERMKWKMNNGLFENFSNLPMLMQEGRWADTYPFFIEIAKNTSFSNATRAYAEIILMQIVLYHFPEFSKAQNHLDNAELFLPDSFITKRGKAQFFLKAGETQKARDGFLNVLSDKPGDFASINYLGDCFATDFKLENAESWYKDAMQKNFIQSESYQRLITLYADKKWFTNKEPLFESLLANIQKRQRFQTISKNNSTDSISVNCFNDATVYQSFREVGAAWYNNENYQTSEEWYKKASNLQPAFTTSHIDIAYLKIYEQKYDEALKEFFKVIEIDKNNFDAYWGLAYMHELLKEKEEAVKAYTTCLQLRPNWDDWINNQIGRLYYAQNEFTIAETYFRKAMEANKNYIIYKQNVADAMQSYAATLVKDNPDSEAEKLYINAAKLADDDIRWNLVGNYYFKIKQWNKAIELYNKSISLNGKNPLYYENRGLAYENMNQFDEAEASYKEALKYDRETGRYFNRLGVFYFAEKKYEDSISYYLQALDKEPDEPIYLDNICLAYEQMGELKKAAPYYHKILSINPNNDGTLNRLGVMYYKDNQFEQAIECYNKAISLKNNDPIYYENRGLAYENMKMLTEAESSYKQALQLDNKTGRYLNRLGIFYYVQKKYKTSIDYYKKALAKEPNETVYLDNICLAYEQMGEQSKAAPYYQKILAITPNDDKILNKLGVMYYKEKNFEEALINYNKAIELNNRESIYYENKAILFRAMGKIPEAIEAFEKSVQINPENDVNWNDAGVLYFNNGNYDSAIEYYNKAIALKPNVALYYENLGLAFEKKGMHPEAITNYNKSLEINPDNAMLLNNTGLIYYYQEDYKTAIKFYQKAINMDAENWIYQTNLGLALRLSGSIDESIVVYKKALQIKDDDYLIWNELGVLLSDKGNHSEAIDAYKKSISLNPNDSVLYLNLALSLNALGKNEDAKRIAENYSLPDDIKHEVNNLLQKNLPSLFL